MGKYFSIEVKPTMPIATQIDSDASDAVFSANDVVFDWTSFEIPKGAARLIDITCIWRGNQTPKALEFYFARTTSTNGDPSSLGTGNATAGGTGYYKDVIGSAVMAAADFKTTIDNLTIGNTGYGTNDSPLGLVLQGRPDSGTNVGFDKIYIALTTAGSSGWNTSTGVLANAAVSAGAASTFVTKTVDPRLFFDVGDVVHVHDSETAIGTVESLTNNDINLTAVTGVAIAEDDEIMNISPITLKLGFEK